MCPLSSRIAAPGPACHHGGSTAIDILDTAGVQRKSTLMQHVYFILVCFIWGTSFILMDRATLSLGPLTIGTAGALGGALMLGIVWIIKRPPLTLRLTDLPMLLSIALIGYAVPFAIQPYLIECIGHGYVGAIVCLVPLMTIAAQIPILRQYPNRTQLTGVLLGFVFLVAYFWDGVDREVPARHLLLAVTIPLAYAVTNVLVKRSMSHVPSVPLACVCLAAAGLMVLPFAVARETIEHTDTLALSIVALLLLAFFSRGFGTALFYAMIRRRGPLFAGMVCYTIPIVVLAWSWFDHEKITLKQLIAVLGALATVIVVQRDLERQARLPPGA